MHAHRGADLLVASDIISSITDTHPVRFYISKADKQIDEVTKEKATYLVMKRIYREIVKSKVDDDGITANDIVFAMGPSKTFYDHPGNVVLRKMISMHAHRGSNLLVASDIISSITDTHPVRFYISKADKQIDEVTKEKATYLVSRRIYRVLNPRVGRKSD